MRRLLLAPLLLLASSSVLAWKCKPMEPELKQPDTQWCTNAAGVTVQVVERKGRYLVIWPDGRVDTLDPKNPPREARKGRGVTIVSPLGDGAVVHHPGGAVTTCGRIGDALVCH